MRSTPPSVLEDRLPSPTLTVNSSLILLELRVAVTLISVRPLPPVLMDSPHFCPIHLLRMTQNKSRCWNTPIDKDGYQNWYNIWSLSCVSAVGVRGSRAWIGRCGDKSQTGACTEVRSLQQPLIPAVLEIHSKSEHLLKVDSSVVSNATRGIKIKASSGLSLFRVLASTVILQASNQFYNRTSFISKALQCYVQKVIKQQKNLWPPSHSYLSGCYCLGGGRGVFLVSVLQISPPVSFSPRCKLRLHRWLSAHRQFIPLWVPRKHPLCLKGQVKGRLC